MANESKEPDTFLQSMLDAGKFLEHAGEDAKKTFLAVFHALRAHKEEEAIKDAVKSLVIDIKSYTSDGLNDIQIDIHDKAKCLLVVPISGATFSLGTATTLVSIPANTNPFYFPVPSTGGRVRIKDSVAGDIYQIYQFNKLMFGPMY